MSAPRVLTQSLTMALFKKGSKLYSILNLKCPRCHEGDLFHTSTWSFQDMAGMPDRCSHCRQNYMPEPGFYYGAMYVSYVFWGFFCVIVGGGTIMGLDWSVNQAMILLVAISAVFFVWLFRTSRAVWFNMMVGYSEEFGVKSEE